MICQYCGDVAEKELCTNCEVIFDTNEVNEADDNTKRNSNDDETA